MTIAKQGFRAGALGSSLVGLFLAAAPSALAQTPAQMPSFDLEAIDGTRSSEKLPEGKVALIDFWATWCEPCLREVAHWNDLYERYRDSGLLVLGVTLQSGSAHEVKLGVERLNVRYPVVIGDQRVEQEFGGVLGLPATFLIDREGRIRKRYLGQYSSKHAQIERDIQELLREKPSQAKVRAR